MDIHAKSGTKVVLAHPKEGDQREQGRAEKHLEVGKEYTVERTEIFAFHTLVYLMEVPDIAFNSVKFESQ